MTVAHLDQSDEELLDAQPLAVFMGSPPQIGSSKRSIIRLDNLIMKAITNLNLLVLIRLLLVHM